MAGVARRVAAEQADATHTELPVAVCGPLRALARGVLHLVATAVLVELDLWVLREVVELVGGHRSQASDGASEADLGRVVCHVGPVLGEAVLALEEVVLKRGSALVVHLAGLGVCVCVCGGGGGGKRGVC